MVLAARTSMTISYLFRSGYKKKRTRRTGSHSRKQLTIFPKAQSPPQEFLLYEALPITIREPGLRTANPKRQCDPPEHSLDAVLNPLSDAIKLPSFALRTHSTLPFGRPTQALRYAKA